MAFMDSVQNAAFAKAYLRILRMPDGVSMAQMREQGDQYEDAAMFISTNLETIGIMVYREIVDFNMVNDLIGDAVVLVWHKLENWATEMRAEQRRETAFEWFQWLAEHIDQHRSERTIRPVYSKLEKWRPAADTSPKRRAYLRKEPAISEKLDKAG